VWALAIARHKAIDWIREQQQSREHGHQIRAQAESKIHDKKDDTGNRMELVQKGIQQLSSAQRIVLTMFYLENLSIKEISKVLDITEGTVKSRLFYAREKLKDIINP
jgi:RNA polymerase sigma-70 factor (ECF subfamily)